MHVHPSVPPSRASAVLHKDARDDRIRRILHMCNQLTQALFKRVFAGVGCLVQVLAISVAWRV